MILTICWEEEEHGASPWPWCPPICPASRSVGRHMPALQMFQNGPNQGKDVFIPLDHVIGGQDQIGKGWPMLMSALAAGRGVSLPSLSAAATALSARTTGAYARIRQQFRIPIGKFEGIQERLGPLAANAYVLDAARRLTCAGLDQGRNLSVISAIMKVHATYLMRDSVDHAMDVHAGKAVIDGPMQLPLRHVSRGPGWHHSRGRQYPDPQHDHFRPGRDSLPSMDSQGDARPGGE